MALFFARNLVENADYCGLAYPSKDTMKSNYVPAKDVAMSGWYWWDDGHPQHPIIVKIGRKTKHHAFREMIDNEEEGFFEYANTVREMGGRWQYIPQPASSFWERRNNGKLNNV